MRWVVATVLCLATSAFAGTNDASVPASAWTPAESIPGPSTLRVAEGDGWLEARGDRLVRVEPDGEVLLSELPGRPTGRIRALWSDPHGGTFVAAENGLFVTHPSVDTVDRLDLRDGAPPGSPVGLVLDRRRRLWLATETSFGVVDTLSFFGRTHGESDGLPPGPFRALTHVPGVGLVLHAESGAWAYRPDRGEPPRLTDVSIDGERWAGRPVGRSWPFTLDVDAAGEGLGGATVRWVEDDHHNWRPLPSSGLEVSGVSPGRRSIDLVAFDRDLRRSPQTRVPLEVSYPGWLEPRVLISVILTLSIGVLLVMLARARRAGGGGPRYAQASISAALIVWLVLQGIAALFPHVRGWPFCGFSMYTWSARENAVSGPVALIGVNEEGRRSEAVVRRFGVVGTSPWPVIRPFLNGDPSQRRALLERYNQRSAGREIDSLLVVRQRQRLTREGKIQVAPLVMGAIDSQP